MQEENARLKKLMADLGLWIAGTEGAKFWRKVFNDLKTRGVNDILITVTDGLKGMPEALAAVFPATTLQTYIVHLIRNSLGYASCKDRKLLAAAIRPIYTAPSAEAARAELDAFEAGAWGTKFPTVAAAWRRAWSHVIAIFAFPAHIRRVIDTTNAIESFNARLRKIIKTRGHFPSDDAAKKLIWLALRSVTADWGKAAAQDVAPTCPPRRSFVTSDARRRGQVSLVLKHNNSDSPPPRAPCPWAGRLAAPS